MSVPSTTDIVGPLPESTIQELRALAGAGRWRTRFAPAPTGELHLGHVVNALYVWGVARAFGGAVTVRIEDHDQTRSRAEFEHGILDDIAWLGLEADDESSTDLRGHPSRFRQSDNADRYEAAVKVLDDQGLVFPCSCTRRDVAMASGRRENEEARYPGTCRQETRDPSTLARRVRFDDAREVFVDLLGGPVEQVPSAQCGDLLVRDRHGNWTYQFAVVVDDIAHGIDVVIRGEDLLESTGRQIRLGRLLGRATPPRFLHHPLVRHADGSKLSKSSGDTAVRELREGGATPAMLFGVAARAVGLTMRQGPVEFSEIVEQFAGC